jgi:selenocysteine-specific translation elongation factor
MALFMKNLTVGIFHDEELGQELGKKGTESDIAMFNRKTDECIFTFMHPVENKLSAKSQIMSNIDFAIISFEEMTPEVGETILMLDSFEISEGIIVTPQYADLSQIKTIINDTTLESFVVLERDIVKIFEILNGIIPKRDTLSKTQVVIDHSFSVKGVGEVMLGVVKKGVVKKHDKLKLLPIDKDIVVRSIQMQDKDFDEAEAGSRVGLAIKGATAEEMNRGYIICDPESVKTGAKMQKR